VKLTVDLGDDELLFLARYDRDPFNRWQALQTAAMRVLVRSVSAIREGSKAPEEPRIADAMAEALAAGDLDPAFVAQILTIPGETDLAQEIGADVDPDAIHNARRALKRSVASRLRPALLER